MSRFGIDFLFQDISKLFRTSRFKQVVNKVVDEKILANDGVDSLLINTRINANNTVQQDIVDGKVSANNSTLTTSITTAVGSTVDAKISTNNTTQQSVVDGKITTNNTSQQSIVDGKISSSATNITNSIPSAVASKIAITPLKDLSDVNDYTAASIPSGYFLGWNTSANEWQPAPGSAAKGAIRLFIAEKASNANPFYFNAITVTSLASASANMDTAFMVTTALLSKVTIDIRSNQASSNSVRIDLYKNGSGTPFESATASIANQSQTLTQYNVIRYTFSGLTLNQYDSIHIKVTPTSNPGNIYGIVTIE